MKKINIKGPIIDNDTAYVYHYFGWDACCPDDVRNRLEESNGEDVTIEINSSGGLCTAGFEMYTMLMEYEGKVTAHVINACSAATFAICASDEALISDMGIVMIHNTQSCASGDYRDMQMEADALKEFNQCILNAYMKKTGRSQEELQEMMNNDTYMSPQKAIEYGFCDGMMFSNGSSNKKTKSEHEGMQGNGDSNGWTNYMMMQAYNSNIQVVSAEKVHSFRMSLEKNGIQSSSKKDSTPPMLNFEGLRAKKKNHNNMNESEQMAAYINQKKGHGYIPHSCIGEEERKNMSEMDEVEEMVAYINKKHRNAAYNKIK